MITDGIVARLQAAFSASTPLDVANRNHLIVAVLYILSLFLVAVLSWLLWTSGNRAQDVVRAEANVRIADADSKAEQAKEGAAKANEGAAKANASAATANERASKLENDNLGLRTQVATLEKQAADAKREAATLGVAVANANQRAAEAQMRTAEAEANLVGMKRQLAPRVVEGSSKRYEELGLFAGTKAFIVYFPGDLETKTLAYDLRELLQKNESYIGTEVGGDWSVLGIEPFTPELMAPAAPYLAEGVHLLTTHDPHALMAFWEYPAYRAARILNCQLIDSGIESVVEVPTSGESWPQRVPRDAVLIKVGLKPQTYWEKRRGVQLWIRPKAAGESDDAFEKRVAEARRRSRESELDADRSRQEQRVRDKEQCREIIDEQRRARGKT